MRKATIVLLALSLFVIIAGCGNNDSSTEGPVYKIATDATYAPMEYMKDGKIVGFDIDFLEAVMNEAGLDYKVENTGWEPLFENVQQATEFSGGISSVSITEERKQTFDFSVPYFESRNMILVKGESAVATSADLKDKKVAVQVGTTADELMSNLLGKSNSNLKRFESNALAFLELQNDGVDAVVADNFIVLDYIKNNPSEGFKAVTDDVAFDAEYYGIILPKDSELKAKIDEAINKIMDNGKYAEVYKKWFQAEPNIENLKNAQ